MSSNGIRAGRAFVELGTNDSKLTAGLRAAQAKLRAFGGLVSKIGGGLMGAGTAVLGPMLGAAAVFAKSGDELSKMADKTGASVESLSELRHAATQSAVEFSQLGSAITKQQRNLAEAADGNATARESFDRLGLSVQDLLALSPDQQFEAIADRIAAIENPALRAQAAMDIFGKSGAELLPLMIGGAKGIQALRQEARDLGLQMSSKDAAAATLLGDTWANVQTTLKDVAFEVGAALAPALTDAMNVVIPFVVGIAKWIGENRQLVVTVAAVAAGVVGAGAALTGIGVSALVASAAIGGLIAMTSALGTVLAAIFSPIGIVIGLIGAAAAAFLLWTDAGRETVGWFSSGFTSLLGTVQEVMGGVFNAIKNGRLDLAAQIAWTSLQIVWRQGINGLLTQWEFFKQAMISGFDSVIVGIRSIWNNVSTWLANKIIWLIARLNGLAGSILGITVVSQDTIDSLREGVTISNEEFQADIRRRKQERDRERQQRIADVGAAWSSEDLERQLAEQIKEADALGQTSLAAGLGGGAATAAGKPKTGGALATVGSGGGMMGFGAMAALSMAPLVARLALMRDGLEQVAETFSGSGTFSAAAVGGMGSDSLAARQAKAAEKSVYLLEGIERNTSRPLAFQ